MAIKKKPAASGKATAAVIDFSNVKERGNFNPKHIDAGDYTGKITKVEQTESKAGDDMWVFTVELDDVPRASYPHYCVLTDNQFWKIKALVAATGVDVGKRKIKIDPNKLVGKSIGVAMDDDEYEGRLKSTIGEVFPPDEVGEGADVDEDEDDDEDNAPPPKKKARKASPPPEDDEEEDEEEEDEPEPPRKKAAKKEVAKKAPAKKRKPVDDDDDEEEDDDEMDIDEL